MSRGGEKHWVTRMGRPLCKSANHHREWARPWVGGNKILAGFCFSEGPNQKTTSVFGCACAISQASMPKKCQPPSFIECDR